jgi:p-cumate 2,3-dioxygenase beta subunit
VEEGGDARARRLDAFLTFYGPGGFATPDDVEALELVQQGLANWADDRWSEMSRGMGKEGEQLNSDEHHLRIFWRRWNELMADGSADMTVAPPRVITRAEVEDFLYYEAALLDEWKLNEWQELLTDDAAYYVPPNDQLEGDHRTTLFLVADDRERIRQRIIRVLDPNCHAEFPKSRTRRLISNVRIVAREGDLVTVAANFVCYRYRRYERIREYVGAYRYILKCAGDSFRIKERRVLIDAHELGTLGSVSFIL